MLEMRAKIIIYSDKLQSCSNMFNIRDHIEQLCDIFQNDYLHGCL